MNKEQLYNLLEIQELIKNNKQHTFYSCNTDDGVIKHDFKSVVNVFLYYDSTPYVNDSYNGQCIVTRFNINSLLFLSLHKTDESAINSFIYDNYEIINENRSLLNKLPQKIIKSNFPDLMI